MSAYSSSDGTSRSGLAESRPAKTPPRSVAPATSARATNHRDFWGFKLDPPEASHCGMPVAESLVCPKDSFRYRDSRRRRKIALREAEHVRLHRHARIDPDFHRGAARLRPEETSRAR